MKISYHGNSNTAEFAKTLEQTAPDGCDLQVGDVVTYINDYGVVFPGQEVIGFDTDHFMNQYGNCIMLDTDAYWFPHKRSELIKESVEEGTKRLNDWIEENKKKK